MPVAPFLRFDDSFSIAWPFAFFDKTKSVINAICIYTGVALMFIIGFNRATAKNSKSTVIKIDDKNFVSRFMFLTTIGFFSFFLIIYFIGGFSNILQGASDRTRAFAGLQGLFLVLNILISVAIGWYVRILNRQRSLSEKVLFVLYTLLAVGITAVQGQKSTIFIAIAAMAVIYNCKVRRIRIQTIIIGVVVMFIVLMAYHVYKQEYLVLGRVVSISEGSQFWSSTYDFLNSQVFGNFMQLQTMSVLLEGMPVPLEYQYGYTYVAGLLLLVPRSIFPDKPLPSTGIFTEAFWPAAWRDLGTTLPPGVFGEAYMNFGVYGAIGAGLIAGYVMGRVHKRYKQNPNSDMALVYYAIMVASMLHFFRGELASVAYLVFSMALPCRVLMTKSNSRTFAENFRR
jgi:oligosaccharide repeat unit polymerase